MQIIRFSILSTALLFVHILHAQLIGTVPAAFANINEKPFLFHFVSAVSGPKGGHLQGIQMNNTNVQGEGHNVTITGSSSTKAYYVSAVLLKDSTALHVLDSMPYRHAGGCQLSGEVMALGLEDNMEKDKAKVVLVNVRDKNAIAVINRKGTFERSTAGAVAYLRLKTDHYLIAVGDWDTKHIDFYKSRQNNVASFDSIATYTADAIKPWGSYQSINLLSDNTNKLYLVGFCLDAKGNRADLFEIEFKDTNVNVKAVASRYFKCYRGVSFRYGAGISVNTFGKLEIIACARKLKKGRNQVNSWE